MKIKKQELLEALAIVKPGLSNKEIIEQSTSFAFMAGRVITYNDDISISHPVTALELEGAIKAEELYQLLNKIKGDEIDIEINETELQIKSGKVKAGLTLQSEVKLPLEELGRIAGWKHLPSNFTKHIKFAAPCCSNDMSRPILTCINITKEGIVQASDSYKLITATLNKEMPCKDFLLPANAAIQVIKLEPSHIILGNGWVHFKTPKETILSCRIFEEAYPDVKPFIKHKGEEITFPVNFADLLDRAAIFAKREHFLDEEVIITIAENKIKIKGKSDTGWLEESANIKYVGELLEIRITPYLLQSIIKETLTCSVNSQKVKFTGEDWIYIAMLRRQ
jgi:hypothetical protein